MDLPWFKAGPGFPLWFGKGQERTKKLGWDHWDGISASCSLPFGEKAETWLCGFGAILDKFYPTEVAAKGLSALGADLAAVSSTHKNQTQATHPILPGDA